VAFEELVRLRVGPFSIGRGKDVAARDEQGALALGAQAEGFDVTGAETCEGRMARASVGTVMEIASIGACDVVVFSSPSDS